MSALPVPLPPASLSRFAVPVVLSVVFGLAFAARLVPALNRQGLFGLGNYDDGVHFAAALGVAHGLLPYRDFLLLHPPGVVVALLPFALLARLTEDATGMAVARLAWMVMGGVNAVLVVRVLRPIGLAGAVLGGLLYAVFWPAVYAEWTTLLEGVGTLCLLAALVLLRLTSSEISASVARLVVAGGLLGFASSIKIWGLLPVAVLCWWLWSRAGRRPAGVLLGSAAAACALVCLPFFVAAPGLMWQMVVGDQLGRRRFAWSPTQRLNDLAGLSPYGYQEGLSVALDAVLVVGAMVTLLAWGHPAGRPIVVLLVLTVAVLMATPAWFLHYACFAAAPTALVFGAGVQHGLELLAARQAMLGVALTVVVAVGVLMFGLGTFRQAPGRAFVAEPLTRAAAGFDGCITSDEPMSLVQMNLLSRNLDRGCPLVVDLGGRSYHRPAPEWADVSRASNRAWQAYALRYFRTGDAVIITRFGTGPGFSRQTRRTVESWPEVARSGRYVLRIPQP